MKIDGKQLASEILDKLKQKLSTKGSDPKVAPTMAVILVGDNPASLSYIKQKQKSAELIGAKVVLKQFPVSISQISLISQISQLNSDTTIHGIIIQRPLPSHIDKNLINESVIQTKDIDGFHPDSKFLSPVGLAVLKVILDIHGRGRVLLPPNRGEKTSPLQNEKIKNLNISNSLKISNLKLKIFLDWLAAKNILLLGRGETGGKPIASTMNKLKINYSQTYSRGVMPACAGKHYAPTQPHVSQKELLKQADIIISAVGKPNFITGNMIKPGAICIGVGISRLPATNSQQSTNNNLTTKQCNNETFSHSNHVTMQPFSHSSLIGDFEESSVSQIASFYTPVPGGVGPLTVAFLLDNLLKSWENNLYK